MKLIATGDWHIRETAPICRIDNYWETQWYKIDWITQLSEKYNCPVIHSGDLFHHWKPSPYLLSMCNEHLPKTFYTVYGNHDLPQHSLKLTNKCGVYVLVSSNRIKLLPNTHWGQLPTEASLFFPNQNPDRSLLVWHVMTFKDKSPYFTTNNVSSAKRILRKYSQYDLILTGDNHQTFVEEYDGRILINPGSIFRSSSAQIDHKPCVFLYDSIEHSYKKIYIPIEKDVISREHIEINEKRNSRIEAFIQSLNADWDSEISFQVNLDRFCEANNVKTEIKELILKFIEYGNYKKNQNENYTGNISTTKRS